MPLRLGLTLIFLALLAMVGAALYVVRLTVQSQEEIGAAEIRRYDSYKLADELRQSSDDLTQMARLYVNTADSRFRDYFERIQAIRNGEAPRPVDYERIYWDFLAASGKDPRPPGAPVALESLMRDMHYTKDDFELLRQSKARSDTLIQFEERAMNAMLGLFADADGHYTIKGARDQDLARKLMHSGDYLAAKAEIMGPIEDFLVNIDKRTAAEVSRLQQRGQRLNTVAVAIMSVSVALILISMLVIQRRLSSLPSEAGRAEEIGGLDGGKSLPSAIWTAWPLLMAGVIACLAIQSTTWWTKTHHMDNMRRETGNTLQAVMRGSMNTLENWFQKLESEMRIWADAPSLKILLQTRSHAENFSPVSGLLNPVLSNGDYEGYLLLTSDGKVLSSEEDSLMGRDISGFLPNSFLTQVMKPPHFTFISIPRNEPGSENNDVKNPFSREILAGAAILNDEDQNIGVLVFRVSPERELTSILRRGRIGETGESYAFNQSGQLLSDCRFDEILRQSGVLGKDESEILNIEIRDPGGSLADGFLPAQDKSAWPLTQMAHRAITGTGGVNLKGYNNYRGVPVIGAWAWNERFGFGLATEMEAREAYQLMRGYKRQARFGNSLAIILILGLTGLFIRGRIRIANANAKLNAAYRIIKVSKDRMEEELNIGREIQMSMIPLTFPAFPDRDEFSIYAMLQPANEVGGDFYDFYFLNENKICFCIGDVSGKGVPAALFMAMTKTLIQSWAHDEHSTATILTHVNEALSQDNKTCMFVTLFVGILEVDSGEVTYTNAGHNPPALRRANGAVERIDELHGPVVGAVEDMTYGESKLRLGKHDLLFLYTDGVTEAMDHNDELYTEQSLIDSLAAKPSLPVEETVAKIVAEVNQFEALAVQSDDITVLGLEYFESAAETVLPHFDINLKNQLSELENLKSRFSQFAEQNAISISLARSINVVIDELLGNIMTYAFKDELSHDIEFRAELKGNRLQLTVIDDGVPFNPLLSETPDTSTSIEERQIGGLGIHVVKNLVDEISYHRGSGRNVLSVVKILEV